jgi:hypothetical protein
MPNKMHKNILGIMLAGTILLVGARPSQAAFISLDLLNSGDALVTLDDQSGIEWLDVSYTRNRSYQDVASELSWGGEFAGWNFATTAQVADLFLRFGLYPTMCKTCPEFFSGVDALLGMVGDTIGVTLPGYFGVEGYTDQFGTNPDGSEVRYSIAVYGFDTSGTVAHGRCCLDTRLQSDITGSFLIRPTSVPEPPTATLLVLALMLQVGIRRRRVCVDP